MGKCESGITFGGYFSAGVGVGGVNFCKLNRMSGLMRIENVILNSHFFRGGEGVLVSIALSIG